MPQKINFDFRLVTKNDTGSTTTGSGMSRPLNDITCEDVEFEKEQKRRRERRKKEREELE